MAEAQNNNNILASNAEFKERADFDFIKRAYPGVLLYIFAWPVLFYWTGFYTKNPVQTTIFGLLFTITSLLRLAHAHYAKKFYSSHQLLWQGSLCGLSLVHASTWGALFYLANLDPSYASLTTLINMVIAVLASSALISLIPKYNLARIYISIMLLPAGLASAFVPELGQLSLVIIFAWCYLMFVATRFIKEYVRAFKIELSLNEKQKELEKLSKTDALTQLYNRFYFDQCLEQVWQTNMRLKLPTVLMVMDIDYFKKINDNYGHLFGDHCLRHAAGLLREKLQRNTDYVFRYGGEEFCVLLSNLNIDEAEQLAETLREHFESSPTTLDGITVSMTMSIGVSSVLPSIKENKSDLMKAADTALYAAKEAGRNQVRLAENKQ